ncbi:MAG TPA: hypothetical protein VG013_06780 [Gemmataceae bacterium]|jgi:hypothetical protein|nr:hypothetical protein [Gemmataceae bacterium]
MNALKELDTVIDGGASVAAVAGAEFPRRAVPRFRTPLPNRGSASPRAEGQQPEECGEFLGMVGDSALMRRVLTKSSGRRRPAVRC